MTKRFRSALPAHRKLTIVALAAIVGGVLAAFAATAAHAAAASGGLMTPAIAPGATIDLVVAKSNDDADILSATEAVAKGNYGDVVSQSFGEAEQCESSKLLQRQHAVFSQLAGNGTTLFASSGDQGAGLPTC